MENKYLLPLAEMIVKREIPIDSELGKAIYQELLINRGAEEQRKRGQSVYNPSYRYNGKENVEADDGSGLCHTAIYKEIQKPCVQIRWFDNTKTIAILRDEDKFDIELGILICSVKKFCVGFNIKKLYCQKKRVKKDEYQEVYADVETIKEALRQILITAHRDGLRMVKDAKIFAKEWNMMLDMKKAKKHKMEKRRKKKAKYFEKIEKLKEEGKWISKEEKEKIIRENEILKKKLEEKENQVDYKKMKEENEEMRKKLGM